MIASLREALGSRELLVHLTLRELRTKYRRSILGWGWSLLNPIVLVIVYTFVFSVVLKVTPKPGDPSGNHYFAFFLFSAILPWNFLTNGIQVSTGAIMSSRPLITKVYFPREQIVFAAIGSLLVTLLVEMFVLQVALAAFRYPAIKYLPMVMVLVVLETVFVTGLGLFISAMSVRHRDIPYLTSVVLTVWFYVTPVLYSIDRISEKHKMFGVTIPLKDIMMANPMARFVAAYRDCLYHLKWPDAGTLIYLVVLSVIAFIGGYIYFVDRAKYFAEDL